MGGPLGEGCLNAGETLRSLRESLGLTIRDVEAASARIAEKHQNPELSISLSRLSDIETKAIVPSIYKLYTLAAVYRRDYAEFLKLYGLDLADMLSDINENDVPKSHRLTSAAMGPTVNMPVQFDPGFDTRTSDLLGRMILRWGTVPLRYLEQFSTRNYSYAYVGTDDWTMYPLLLPGSFVQVDEGKNKVVEGIWRSEYERPIYFVETREGFTCCWCEINGPNITLKPHPMSPAKTRVLRCGKEADVIGQVVAIAMRLDDWIGRGERED